MSPDDDFPESDISRLPPETENRIRQAGVDVDNPEIRTAISIATAYAGPIPPPAMLNAYRSVHPDLPEKIVAWTETQMAHRHAMETTSVRGAEARMNRGQIFTFAGTIIGMCLAAGVGVAGNTVVASVIAVVAVGGPTAAFVLARTLDWGMQRPSMGANPERPPSPPPKKNQQKDRRR